MASLKLTPRTALGVFAHPDDETFGPGSTLAHLSATGCTVHLFCATRGESGTIGESASFGRRHLASIREQELSEACRVLGVEPPILRGFPDSGLHRLEEETLIRPIVKAIRDTRPDILITFHPAGISGHGDHRTITQRTSQAFHLAAEERWPDLGLPHAPSRLWAYGIPESLAQRVTGRRMHPIPDPEVDAALNTSDYIPTKVAAVAAHATQKPFIDWLESHVEDLDDYWSTESFVLMEARIPLDPEARPVKDLFHGM